MRTGLATACAAAGLLGAASAARATPACSVEALAALHVPDVTVTAAVAQPAAGTQPAHCDVQSTIVTRGMDAADGSARFAMQLPDAWQRRFLFYGVGGNAGNLRPSANEVDRAAALGKGYVTVVTDTGHSGDGVAADWTRLPDGQPDQAKRIDFFHRAAHAVTVAGKAFTQAFYGSGIEHAYFDGCSTGGRMAMMEAERYPGDYDGVIAGDPMMSFHTYTARAIVQRAALSTPDAYIPESLVRAIDARVTAQCDAIDGARDGLVQDSAACHVRAEDLICRPRQTDACLNPAQARVLRSYTSPFLDRQGHVVLGPWPITHMSDPLGVPYTVTGQAAPDLQHLASPWTADPAAAAHAWALVQQMVTYWLGMGPDASVADLDVDPSTNTAGDKMLALMDATYADGNVRDPAKLDAFIAQGRKMILYHGTSDPSIPPSQTVAFYGALEDQLGGAARTQQSVRLFLVPGMHHCSGGAGPDRFDTLSALEGWVEHGQAPDAILASTRPGSPAPHHLPLCPFPQQGRYNGAGEMDNPANWHCQAGAAQ